MTKRNEALEKAALNHADRMACKCFGEFYIGADDFSSGALWLARRLRRIAKRYGGVQALKTQMMLHTALSSNPVSTKRRKSGRR